MDLSLTAKRPSRLMIQSSTIPLVFLNGSIACFVWCPSHDNIIGFSIISLSCVCPLWLCSHDEMSSFVPEKYWTIQADITKAGHSLTLEWVTTKHTVRSTHRAQQGSGCSWLSVCVWYCLAWRLIELTLCVAVLCVCVSLCLYGCRSVAVFLIWRPPQSSCTSFRHTDMHRSGLTHNIYTHTRSTRLNTQSTQDWHNKRIASSMTCDVSLLKSMCPSLSMGVV